MYQRTHSSMMSASNTRLRYIGSRAIGFVILHPGQTKSGSLSDVPGCTRTRRVTPKSYPARGRDIVGPRWTPADPGRSHRRGRIGVGAMREYAFTQPLTGNPHGWRHTEIQRHLPRPFPKRPPEVVHEHRCG